MNTEKNDRRGCKNSPKQILLRVWTVHYKVARKKSIRKNPECVYVPEVLNVQMNEMQKTLKSHPTYK